MKHSAQAIIVDRDGNIILEKNTKIWSLSFIGGKVEEWESYESALLRELREELWIEFHLDRLLRWEIQEKRIFPTGEWVSKYFVLILEDNEETIVKNAKNMETYDFKSLERLNDSEFPIERMSFLSQVQRALDALQ